jgi:hypothetical protein
MENKRIGVIGLGAQKGGAQKGVRHKKVSGTNGTAG